MCVRERERIGKDSERCTQTDTHTQMYVAQLTAMSCLEFTYKKTHLNNSKYARLAVTQ